MSREPENHQVSEFKAESHRRQTGLVREFFAFLKHNKKWWLTPIVLIILLAGYVIVSMGGLGPFIYAIF